MKCYLFCTNVLEYWREDSVVAKHCKNQHDVFMFNPESGTACCEAALSYAMEPAYGTFQPKVEDSDDPTSVFYDENRKLLELIDEEIAMSLSTEVKYYKCSYVKGLPHFTRDEIPHDDLPDNFVIVDDVDHEDVEDIEEFLDDVRGNPDL